MNWSSVMHWTMIGFLVAVAAAILVVIIKKTLESNPVIAAWFKSKSAKKDSTPQSVMTYVYLGVALGLLALADFVIHLCFPDFFRWLYAMHPGNILVGLCMLIAHVGVVSFVWSNEKLPGIFAGFVLYLAIATLVIWPVRAWGPHVGLYTFGIRYTQPHAGNYVTNLEYQTVYAQYDNATDTYRVRVPLSAEAVIVRTSREQELLYVPETSIVVFPNVFPLNVKWPKPYDRFGVWQDGAGEILRGPETTVVMIKELREYRTWRPHHQFDEQFAIHDDAQLGSVVMRVGNEFQRIYDSLRIPVFIPPDTDRRICFAINLPKHLRPENRGSGEFVVAFRFQSRNRST